MHKSIAAILDFVPRSKAVAKLLRFPPDLAEAIQQEAERGVRSFSAQVFLMLRLAIKHGLTHPAVDGERRAHGGSDG